MKGIDVSKWNGVIDFEKAKSCGIDFVIIRAGFGTTGIDPRFAYNYKAARKAGLHVGAYWYSYAKTKSELQNEISAFINAINGLAFDMPIYWDIEEKWVINNINYVIPTVCNALESEGYFAGYYTSASINNTVTTENKKRYTSWIAHWGKTPGAYKPMHQHSSTGKISGINGDVDIDYCTCDFTSIITKKGLNNTSLPTNNKPDAAIQKAINKINDGVNILENLK